MKKYEFIETGNTAVVDIHGKDPIFLNETATSIIKRHTKGLSSEDIKSELRNEYSISPGEIEAFEHDVDNIISSFESMIEIVE